MKKWTVITSRNDTVEVEAEKLQLNESAARLTFFTNEAVVASFVGYSGVYPVVDVAVDNDSAPVDPAPVDSEPAEPA